MPHPAPLTIRQLSVGICISYLFPSQLYQQYAILIFKAIVNLSQNKNLVKHHLPGHLPGVHQQLLLPAVKKQWPYLWISGRFFP